MELYISQKRARLIVRAWSWEESGWTMGRLADVINEKLAQTSERKHLYIDKCEEIYKYNDEILTYFKCWSFRIVSNGQIEEGEWNKITEPLFVAINSISNE